MAEVGKEYIFRGPDGQASLPGLFAGRGQLLIYHFMFDPDWDEGCESCSFPAAASPTCTPGTPRWSWSAGRRCPRLEAFRQRMSWIVPWYSSSGSDFNYDFHVTPRPGRGPGRVQLPGP